MSVGDSHSWGPGPIDPTELRPIDPNWGSGPIDSMERWMMDPSWRSGLTYCTGVTPMYPRSGSGPLQLFVYLIWAAFSLVSRRGVRGLDPWLGPSQQHLN